MGLVSFDPGIYNFKCKKAKTYKSCTCALCYGRIWDIKTNTEKEVMYLVRQPGCKIKHKATKAVTCW